MTTVSIAGSTGSIGCQALDVIEANTGRFELTAIGAYSNVVKLVEQAQAFRPKVVAIADESKSDELRDRLPAGIEVRAGSEALASIASDAQVVLNAVVGFAGLDVTLSALSQGRRLALANKESLVAGGALVRKIRGSTNGGELLPVDSEHGALHQCLRSETSQGAGSLSHVSKLTLTASGGPFRGKSLDELSSVTVDEALTHPTWSMGPKITIDSSTLFNKGLEVIEAHELFDVAYDRIDVVVHPQSIVHSSVEFTDGSTIAQLSNPDMRLPIGYALGHPERLPTPFGSIDWARIGSLDFEAPDRTTFRCLDLAYAAGKQGGTAPTCLNAANEVAVEAFLNKRVTWLSIASIIEQTLESTDFFVPETTQDVISADFEARHRARQVIDAGVS